MNFELVWNNFYCPILAIMFDLSYESFMFVYNIFWLVCYSTYFTFVLQSIKFITLLLLHPFSNTSRLKHLFLTSQMNIDKDLSEISMDLDDDVLYSFIDATSLKNNIPFFFSSFDWCFVKT